MADQQISDLIGADPERAGQLLVERLVESMGADPQLQELLMIAALPRAFDAALLATLTGKDPADAEFAGAFSGLIANAVVYQRSAEMYSLHDTVRSALLLRWREREDLSDYLERLLAYYDGRYQQARKTAEALAHVGAIMRRVHPSRWSAAVERAEDLLIRPAIEALHVALMIGPDKGWEQLTVTFVELEGRSRFRLCGMLVSAFAEDTGNVPAEARTAHEGWSAYYAARLANDRRRWEEADQLIARVEQPEEIDLKLASWLYSEKARSLRGQYRFDEALAMHDRDIAIYDQHQTDAYNAHVPWGSKAEIYRQLWDQDREAAALQEAVRLARAAENKPALIDHQLSLVDALTLLGDVGSAVSKLLDAVRTVRLEPTLEVSTSLRLAQSMLSCLGPRSARLLDAISTQYRQLAQPDWPSGELDLLLMRADAFAAGGSAPATAACFDQARQLAAEQLPERVWEVDTDRAGQSDILAESRLSAEVNLKILQDPVLAADKWTRARCRYNAVEALMEAGDFSEALGHLREARKVWESMHHDRATSLTWATEAELLRRLGDLDKAREALANVSDTPAQGYESSYHTCAARLSLDREDYPAAVAHSRKAMAVTGRTDRTSAAIRAALLAIESLLGARLFVEATEIASGLPGLLSQLDAFCQWRATDNTRLADEHAARAIRIMAVGLGPDTTRRHSAREHLEMATSLDPAFGWFHLELALVDLGEGRQRQATRRLAEAARLTEDEALRVGIDQLRAELGRSPSGDR